MRKIKGVDPGYPQVGYDLSNAELRIVAELSGDDMFLSAFAEEWDLHTLNCCELFSMDYPPSRIKGDIHYGDMNADWRMKYAWKGEEDARRKFGKIFNFRVLYGGDPKGGYKIPGAGKLGLSRSELEDGGYRWLAAHPKLNAFWEQHGMEAMQRFCTRNAFGRRRILCSPDEMARYREGVNHPVQSFVSDLINQIVVETFVACNELELLPNGSYAAESRKYLLKHGSKVRLVGQMHDSLLFGFAQEEYESLKELALSIAQRPRKIGNWTFQFPVDFYEKPDNDWLESQSVA